MVDPSTDGSGGVTSGTAVAATSGSGGDAGGGAQSSTTAQSGAGGGAAQGVPCPDAPCGPDSWCLLCKDGAGQPQHLCRDTLDWPDDVCAELFGWGPLYLRCDGSEDCPEGEVCSVVPGSVGTFAECAPRPACLDDCSCGGGAPLQVCHDVSECAACAASCSIADPELPIAGCQ